MNNSRLKNGAVKRRSVRITMSLKFPNCPLMFNMPTGAIVEFNEALYDISGTGWLWMHAGWTPYYDMNGVYFGFKTDGCSYRRRDLSEVGSYWKF